MIDELKVAGEQLRAAWDNYLQIYSKIHNYIPQARSSHALGLSTRAWCQPNTELESILSYERRMQEMKTTISKARNYSSGLAPINGLPPEILGRIFHISVAGSHNIRATPDVHRSCKYPGYLAQVCTLWRIIVLSTCSLWCHVEFTSEGSHHDVFLRASIQLERASGLPMGLYVDDLDLCPPYEDYSRLCELVYQASSKVERLELVIHGQLGGVPQ